MPALGRAAGAALAAALAAGCAPEGVTSQGRAINDLYNLFMAAAAVVFSVVSLLVLWSVVRYRRTSDELPRQVHGNNRLELLWTLIPLALVFFLFAATMRTQNQVQFQSPDPAVEVKVTAFQWSWIFEYEGGDRRIVGGPGEVPEMVVPLGVPVRVELSSADVVHSFYVPRALFKRQAIPGRSTTFDITFDEPGVYRGQCALYCGLDHDGMLFTVRVVPEAEFQQWLAGSGQAETGT